MFYSIKELVEQADLDFNGNVAELMIATEYELTGRERDEVLRLMSRNLEVMKASVLLGLDESKSRSGLTGGDAAGEGFVRLYCADCCKKCHCCQ